MVDRSLRCSPSRLPWTASPLRIVAARQLVRGHDRVEIVHVAVRTNHDALLKRRETRAVTLEHSVAHGHSDRHLHEPHPQGPGDSGDGPASWSRIRRCGSAQQIIGARRPQTLPHAKQPYRSLVRDGSFVPDAGGSDRRTGYPSEPIQGRFARKRGNRTPGKGSFAGLLVDGHGRPRPYFVGCYFDRARPGSDWDLVVQRSASHRSGIVRIRPGGEVHKMIGAVAATPAAMSTVSG